MRLRAVLLSVAIMALAAPGFSQTPLIADLTEHQIQITTGFVGTDVLLFGTVAADSHVVRVVRGPEADAAGWRKEDRTRLLSGKVDSVSYSIGGCMIVKTYKTTEIHANYVK